MPARVTLGDKFAYAKAYQCPTAENAPDSTRHVCVSGRMVSLASVVRRATLMKVDSNGCASPTMMGVSRYDAMRTCRVSLEQGINAGKRSQTGSTPASSEVYKSASASADVRVARLSRLGAGAT